MCEEEVRDQNNEEHYSECFFFLSIWLIVCDISECRNTLSMHRLTHIFCNYRNNVQLEHKDIKWRQNVSQVNSKL